MKVSELFEEVVTEKVAPEVSAAFPKGFINNVYKSYNLDAHELPEYLNKKPTLDVLKKGIVLSQGTNGKFAAVGYVNFNLSFGGDVGLITDDQPSGHTFAARGTAGKMVTQLPKGKYFFLPYRNSGYYKTRGQEQRDREHDANSSSSYDILEYMNKTFGPKLKTQVEGYLDDIFANLRKLKTDRLYNYSKTDRENAISAAGALEDLVKRGFNRETMEEWLRANNASAYGSWGSIPNNYANFVKLMNKEPNSRAKFAKMIFSRAKQLHKSVEEMLGSK